MRKEAYREENSFLQVCFMGLFCIILYVCESAVYIFVFDQREAGQGFEPRHYGVPCSSQRKKMEKKKKKPNNGKRKDERKQTVR